MYAHTTQPRQEGGGYMYAHTTQLRKEGGGYMYTHTHTHTHTSHTEEGGRRRVHVHTHTHTTQLRQAGGGYMYTPLNREEGTCTHTPHNRPFPLRAKYAWNASARTSVRAGVIKITSHVTLIHDFICRYMRAPYTFHDAVKMFPYTLTSRAPYRRKGRGVSKLLVQTHDFSPLGSGVTG